jgi:hypothetical protein
MTIEKDGRGEARCQSKCRQPRPEARIRFATIIAAALSLGLIGLRLTDRQLAQAAEITFRCLNPASGATWTLKIDDERQTADSLAAEITPTRAVWHDTVHGGSYELDRRSGLLTFRNASSTGGYILYFRCQAS